MKLIINADDYGMDENRTRAIQECFERGLITQTTLMVNMPWADRSVDEAKRFGIFDRIGLHLNYTEGVPLTDAMRQCKIFCDVGGRYTGAFHRSKFRRFFLPADARQAVAIEARAQMEKFISYGLPLMHLDSHHHSHTDWSIARIAMPIAREFGFRSVRLSRNFGSGLVGVKRIYKEAFNAYVRRNFPVTTDYFGGFAIAEDFSALPFGSVVEMMTHPYYYNKQRADLNGELGNGCQNIGTLTEFVEELRGKVDLVSYSGVR